MNAPTFLPTKSESSNPDALTALKAAAAEARDLEQTIVDLESRLKEAKSDLNTLYQSQLPELMDKAGVDQIGIPANGNSPPMDFQLKPFYAASIAASWPDAKKDAAFDYLKSVDAGDLIKTKVEASLPKGDLTKAEELVKAATALGITTKVSLSVHAQTLTAWLRDLADKGKLPPQSDLEKIGGTVGRVVKPRDRK